MLDEESVLGHDVSLRRPAGQAFDRLTTALVAAIERSRWQAGSL